MSMAESGKEAQALAYFNRGYNCAQSVFAAFHAEMGLDEALALRHQILAGRKGPLILSLSRLQVQKGIDVMVEVAARVQARHPGVVFVQLGAVSGGLSAWGG